MIKLPPNKFTVREREMLMGVAGAPQEYFAASNPLWAGAFLAVGAVAGAVGMYVYKLRKEVRRESGHLSSCCTLVLLQSINRPCPSLVPLPGPLTRQQNPDH